MELPATLSDGSRLILPPVLAAAYLSALRNNGLNDIAAQPRPDPAPVGGLSKEQADTHFAHAFDGSVARAQLALLDPMGEVSKASSTLVQFLSGGGLCLTDVPCGAGAGALSLLCTIGELRLQEVLPRHPLHVHLLWGEISDPAKAYAKELLDGVEGFLNEQAIFVSYELFSWDVLCPLSNANLVEKIILSKNRHSQTLLLISNFNGFLERGGKREQAYPQISELLRYCSGTMNAAIWIEPKMNTATKALFPWFLDKLSKLAAFVKVPLPGTGNETTEYRFSPPFKPDSTVAVRLAVMPLDLVRD